MAENIHKLKITGTELDSRLDQIKANESQIQAASEALEANASADAELKAKVDSLVIPTKTSELENDAKFITAADVDTSNFATKEEIENLATKDEIKDFVTEDAVKEIVTVSADPSAEIDALKKQLSALSDYVAENIEAQIIQDVPSDPSVDLSYASQNVVIKGTSDALEMTKPVTVTANSIIVKNVEFPTKNAAVKLTAKN